MKWGVVVFPGSNCDYDAYDCLGRIMGQEVKYIWHKERDLSGLDAIMLPGGFSYGDALRAGAIARFSPVMDEVIRFVNSGRTVIGVCNGFQVLTESGLLPGALVRNTTLRFICEDHPLRIENATSRFTHKGTQGQVLHIPVAHNEGNYVVSDDELKRLQDEDRVLFRYSDEAGLVDATTNPNGSTDNIAGVINKTGNVLGMMPHPERRVDSVIAHTEGRLVFESIIEEFARQ